MAKKRAEESGSSELMQIVLLTLAMTGAGLLVLYLVLRFYMVPNAQAIAEAEAKNYSNLVALISSDEMQRLRKEAEEKKEAGDEEKSLTVAIDEALSGRGLSKDRFGLPGKERDGAVKQGITVKPAPLQDLLQFAVQVRDAKKTIEIHSISLNSPSRGQDAGNFGATMEFVDYAAPKDE